MLSDYDSWINRYIPVLLSEWLQKGHSILWLHHISELIPGDFCFLLGFSRLLPLKALNMFQHTLVIHESDLPQGKGWSPLTWQILEGKDTIPVSLLEAEEKPDSGSIYAQEWIRCQGHELVEELRRAQAMATVKLCRDFVDEYPEIVDQGRPQEGEESVYRRRGPRDSHFDPDLPIRDQFNLLRVVDNERYAAWFELNDVEYILRIAKKSEYIDHRD